MENAPTCTLKIVGICTLQYSTICKFYYLSVLAGAAFLTGAFVFEDLFLPKVPELILPFFVLISPRPIIIYLLWLCIKKARYIMHLAFKNVVVQLDF